jgi:hypothetical protein
VAYKENNGHTAVGLNAYLGFVAQPISGDWGRTIVNAGRWLDPDCQLGNIRLKFAAHVRDGFKVVQLKYRGATSPTVDVYRNGALLATATNDGTYQDVLRERGIFTYQVCDAGTTNCSNEVEVRFRGP